MDKQQEQKPLSERQAARCEQAKDPVCQCRCGGRLHGAKRSGEGGASAAFLAGLTQDDPHYVPDGAAKGARRLERLEEEQRGYRAVDKIWRQAWLAAEYGKGIPAREDAVLAAGPALLAEGGDFARGVRRYLAQSVDHRLHMTVEAPRRSCSRCSRGGDTRQGGAREHE